MLRKLLAGGVLLAIIAIGVAVWREQHSKKPIVQKTDSSQKTETNTTRTTNPNRIRLLATGDFIAHDSVNAAAKKADGSYDYLQLMSDFVPIFKQTDINFCNDPILNGGAALGISGYPKFNSPTEFVSDMGRLGCNLVNTASNHSFDFSQANISASVDAWDNVPNMLAVAGENRNQAEHDTVHYFTMKGVKFAFLAYTTYSNTAPQNGYGVNVFNQTFATQQIKTAKDNGAQIIIVSMRWGTEYSSTVNATQTSTAQFLANQGVDLVLGHGPHVLQPAQKINNTVVYYSLGNFINTQEPPETLFNGVALIDFDVRSKQITNQQFLPLYMHYEWTAAQAAADQIAARHNVRMYLLESATQSMIDAQQLKTTVAAQKQRLQQTLNVDGLNIPLITSSQL